MRLEKFGNELELLLMLTDNNNYTAQQLADRLCVTRRNLYYYLDYLRNSGFQVIKTGACYRLDPNSKFFRRLHDNIVFTKEEAAYLRRMLEASNKKDLILATLKTKLDRYYSLEGSFSPAALKRIHNNVRTLKEAMETQSVVVLRGYSSPHSNTVSDRVVEPYLLMNDDLDVRCYEMRSDMCKTFKVSRIKSVEVMDVFWVNQAKHRDLFTDIFMFSGDEKLPVKLRLGQLAYNLLLEEYPQSQPFLAPEKDGRHWIFKAEVASYLGIGRFVLGLFQDVEVLQDQRFKQYVACRVEQMRQMVSGSLPVRPAKDER